MGDPRTLLEAGEHAMARQAALEGLREAPDDPELLSVAGRAGVELGAPDATAKLKRVTELDPESAGAWRYLGDSLAADGESAEAVHAFERALELNPQDEEAEAQLGYAQIAAGWREGAVEHLEQVARSASWSRASTAAINLVDLYIGMGDTSSALEASRKVAERQPDAVEPQLAFADLALELEHYDEAAQALERARRADEIADHELYALHALALVEIRRGDEERALDLAREALEIDERGLSADLALHLDIKRGGSGTILDDRASTVIARVPPSPEELDAALVAEMGEHRRLHADDPVAGPEAPSG